MHFLAAVLIPADAAVTEDAVRAAMAPYDENESDDGWWDWWSIGGRWTGVWADGYDAYEDPANKKPCLLCDSTGMRNDPIGKRHRQDHPDYTCNGCNGTGQALKHASEFVPVALDRRPVADIGELREPYTVVTPNGAWHRETWNGDKFVKDEHWTQTYRQALNAFPAMHAVVVDYHC